ncbi:S-layer homology domain-containing protein [Fusibacter bizertensis]
MKLFKKYLAVTMAIMLVVSAFPTFTYADPAPALVTSGTYTIDAGAYTIQGGSGLIVEGETTVADFITNLTFEVGAVYKVVTDATYVAWQQVVTDSSGSLTIQTSWDDPSATAKADVDTLSSTDKLVVKSGDDVTLEVYTITTTAPVPAPAPGVAYTATTNAVGDKITINFGAALKDQTYDPLKFAVKVDGNPADISIITLNPDNTKLDIILTSVIGSNTAVVTVSISDATLLFEDTTAISVFDDLAVTNAVPEVASENYGAWSIYSHTGDWGEDPFPAPDNDDRGQEYNKHIIIANMGQRITFYGYGSPAYKDFMIMDNTEDTTKIFDFQLDLSGVSYHSMEGGGFLFNTQVTDGKLYGYAILILSTGPTLYKIDGVDIDLFHETTSKRMTDFAEITVLGNYSLNSINGSLHDIRVEASSSSVEMWDNGAKIINGVSLPTNYGHGIGLIASYASHGCNELSYFTYTDLTIRGINVIWPIMDLTAVVHEDGDKAELTFTAPTGASSVVVQQSTNGTDFTNSTVVGTVDATSTSAVATGLAPNVKYYFRLLVTGGSYAGPSNVADITLPPAPVSSLAATANDKALTITFPALVGSTNRVVMISSDDGENYTEAVLQAPLTAEATSAKIINLTNGTKYKVKIIVTGGGYDGTSNVAEGTPAKAVVIVEPEPEPTTQPTTDEQVKVVINGVTENAGSEKKTNEGSQSVVTVKVNNAVIESKMEEAIKNNTTGTKNSFQVPIADTKSDVAKVELTGDIVKKLETNTFDISIKRDNIDYVIPAKEFTIDSIANKLGVTTEALVDIKIEVKITKLDASVTDKYNQMAANNASELIFPPVSFEIHANTTNVDGTKQEVTIDKFSNYVERVLEIPEGIDPNKITTGIVFNPDGTYSHVPTDVYQVDGRWYARLNSLTNSDYSIIWNPVVIASVSSHWSKVAVNDMASRLVVFNTDSFDPNKGITRGDFAEYIVRALGLYRVGGESKAIFADVSSRSDRALAINIAVEYGLMTGYTDGLFRPKEVITHEEAIAVFSKAMAITELKGDNVDNYKNFKDFEKIASWATDFTANVLSADFLHGNAYGLLDPKAGMTYAEAAAAIRNLLIEAKLINQ